MLIGVIGGSNCSPEIKKIAYEVGKRLAQEKHIIICGGLTGVMEGVCKGAKEVGGLTVGILPGATSNAANPYVDIPIASGVGYARNAMIVQSADILIAIDGEYGTLSEIGFALSMKKKIIGLKTWDIPGIIKVETIDEMMEKLNSFIKNNPPTKR